MKLLVVYNTCGIKRDNTEWYIKCINSLLEQNFDDYRVVVSSCLNSMACFKTLYQTFKDKISYCYYGDPYTINITFNKTVQECTKYFGGFEGYLYVDSGVLFNDSNSLKKAYEFFKNGPHAFVTIQVDEDAGYDQWNIKDESGLILKENLVVPLGSACNLHSQIFSYEAYRVFNNKLMPDVFRAYCTESTFSFLCAALQKKWIILKDVVVRHKKGVDGASASVPHWSPVHKNHWNNLFYGRNAIDFINDPEAIEAGLGYEECNKIMMHKKDAFDERYLANEPEKLRKVINKWLFLTKEEFDYDNMKCNFIP